MFVLYDLYSVDLAKEVKGKRFSAWPFSRPRNPSRERRQRAMKIEILFPEFCNLYGDLANMDYLRRCCPRRSLWRRPSKRSPCWPGKRWTWSTWGP